MVALRQAKAHRLQRFAWIAWYPMARNAATFLEVCQGSKGDIRAREFFDRGSVESQRWEVMKANRLKTAPPALARLYADASQAAAHLSWKRVTQPDVQVPSSRVTTLLLLLWQDFRRAVPQPYRQLFHAEWVRLRG